MDKPEHISAAEARLRKIAADQNIPMHELSTLLLQSMKDENKYKKEIVENLQMDNLYLQQNVYRAQLQHETVSTQLETLKLERKLARIKFWNKVKFWKAAKK